MHMKILAVGIALMICLNVPATAEMYKIENPASNIDNPASRMDNPNPLSPPTQPVPQPAVKEAITTPIPSTQVKEQPHPQYQSKKNIPQKNYQFKTANEYLDAVKKTFNRKNYQKALSITEEALGRIRSGTLKASKKTKAKLNEYRVSGYKLLDKMKSKKVKEP